MVQKCWSAKELYSYLNHQQEPVSEQLLNKFKRLSEDLFQAKVLLSQVIKAGLEDPFIFAFI